MNIKNIPNGVIPVMLTPFNEDLSIDYPSLEKLIEWYLSNGAVALFAACQSSEIMYLDDNEIQNLVKFIVQKTNGRVPVLASGHTADSTDEQIKQLQGMVDAGADGIVLITNRLGDKNASDEDVINNITHLANNLPEDTLLGLYECPTPWKRLLTDKVIQWCVDSGKFGFLKDTCCAEDILETRLEITKGTDFKIYNANGPTLLFSLQHGAAGYSGIMANYFCEPYVWLCKNYDTPEAETVSNALATASLIEFVSYPVSAKYAQKKMGNFTTTKSRVLDEQEFFKDANKLVVDQTISLIKNK
ncbi:dihydrodipicolinate synthase family protein [Vibrio sp. MA40-2]|uniref:dihydrodipicolinate synthase family protein n=1 Tax=Vibrio sp. MA40-2 TaxID=3391828 RepID=UPI0039A60EFE